MGRGAAPARGRSTNSQAGAPLLAGDLFEGHGAPERNPDSSLEEAGSEAAHGLGSFGLAGGPAFDEVRRDPDDLGLGQLAIGDLKPPEAQELIEIEAALPAIAWRADAGHRALEHACPRRLGAGHPEPAPVDRSRALDGLLQARVVVVTM